MDAGSDPVSGGFAPMAVPREGSTVFAALIRRPVPGEKAASVRAGLMAPPAAGRMIMERAG